jgi:AcrR family transcriptional regulator
MAKIDLQRRAEIGEERRQKRKHAFIEAAMALISEEQSLHAITPDALVKKAGGSRGTFYNYFNGVEDVLADVATYITKELNETMLSGYDNIESGPVRLAFSTSQFFAKAETDVIWAETLLRLVIEANIYGRDSAKFFEADLDTGRKHGDFTLMDNQIANIVVGGIVSFSLSAIAQGSFSNDQKKTTLEIMLLALGTSKSTARKSVEKALKLGGAK